MRVRRNRNGCAMRLMSVIAVMLVLVAFVAFMPPDKEAEEILAVPPEIKPQVIAEVSQPTYDADYMLQVINYLSCGDLESAKEAMALRDKKIEALGIEAITVDAEKLYLVAKIVQAEAGSSWLSDDHQRSVASVLLNRTASPEFPNTIKECIHQPGQYYGANNSFFAKLVPSERAVRNALYVLENGSILPATVVFQANFRQGSGTYKTIKDKYLGTTYFCYTSYPGLYE